MKDARSTIPTWVVVAYLTLILVRMFLTSHDEFLPWGADSADYVAASNHDIWFGQERGGVSWMASVSRHLGLPFKLVLDAAYVGICFAASRRLVRATGSEPAGLIAFFLLAFSSYFFRASLIFLSDPPTTCLMLAAVLVFSRFLDRPVSQWRWLDALACGAVLTLWALTRREELVIYASIFLLVISLVFLHRFRWHEDWNWRALLLVVPIVLMLAGGEAVRVRNIAVHHISTQSRYSGPGSAALLSALYSIPPDREIRYCPVTNTTFEAAARVSPTMQPLLPKLLDPQNIFRRYASDRYHIPGEVCTWLNFLLLDVYGNAYSIDDGSADKAMLSTAREIRAAQSSGKLARRMTFYPADPAWRQWLPELPHTFLWGAWNSFGLHYDGGADARLSRQTEVMPLAMDRDFSHGLLQRDYLLDQGQLDVSGTLRGSATSNAADFVVLRENDEIIGASPIYPFIDLMHVTRFNISTHPIQQNDAVTLEFWKADRMIQSEPLPTAEASVVSLNNGAETWDVTTWHAGNLPSLAHRLQQALVRVNDFVLLLGLVCCFILAFVRARHVIPTYRFELTALVLTALCFLLPRIGFYSLLDLWLKWDSTRYFGASSGAALMGIVCAATLAGTWLGARRTTSALRSPRTAIL